MSLIKISDLNPAGSDLFATTDSFMNELQETEATAVYGGGKSGKGGGGNSVFIFGGFGGGYGGGFGGGYGRGYGRGNGRGRGRGYGGGYYC